jgi:aspartate aminotransferase
MIAKTLRHRKLVTIARQAQFSTWAHVAQAEQDPIYGVMVAFAKETNPKKQLLGLGVYRCDKGKPVILECVRRAEKKIR